MSRGRHWDRLELFLLTKLVYESRGPIQIDGGQIHKRLHASDHYPLSFDLIQPRASHL